LRRIERGEIPMMEELKKGYIGNLSQLVTLRRVEVREGRARGTEIIEVVTASGLHLDILTDAGLDIGQARYKGINVSWISKNGYDSPAAISTYETEFVNTFPGGLLYTCGLRNAGPANRDNGEWHPLHGRYHSLQAEQVCAYIADEEIVVSGIIRETALFGHVLEVKRTIRIPVYGSKITIHDTLMNLTPHDEEFMIIYHCNFGYPLLCEKARLILPKDRETIPRTEFAKTGLGRECEFDKPIDSEEERVFFHKMQQDFTATLQNPDLGIQMDISWSGDTLPILAQWRSMASGDYVLGLESANCYIMGRHDERNNGTLQVIKGFETKEFNINIEFMGV